VPRDQLYYKGSIPKPERKAHHKNQGANLYSAYHEGGHALVYLLTKGAREIEQATVGLWYKT
jgi:ATP-dependent Zn protease